MARCFSFSVVQIAANAPRNERLNVGIAVLAEDGLDIRLPRTLSKVHALSHALEESSIRAAAEKLTSDYRLISEQAASVEERLEELDAFSPFTFSKHGEFFASSPDAYEVELDRLMKQLVEPEPALAKSKAKKPSHLAVLLRRAFRKERILAAKGEDLSDHRIVTNVVLAEGFAADFVLKNGIFHVIETVDATLETLSPKKVVSDVAVSALTIEQAKITFGEPSTQARLVYQANAATEIAAQSALAAAAHQGVELINWASEDDQRKFLATFASLAEPLPKKSKSAQAVHASMQHRLSLN